MPRLSKSTRSPTAAAPVLSMSFSAGGTGARTGGATGGLAGTGAVLRRKPGRTSPGQQRTATASSHMKMTKGPHTKLVNLDRCDDASFYQICMKRLPLMPGVSDEVAAREQKQSVLIQAEWGRCVSYGHKASRERPPLAG